MAATRKLAQSQLELQAQTSGATAIQRAQDSRTRNQQQTRNREEGARQFDEGTNQKELDRWQRQWEEKRANELRQSQLDEQTRQFDVTAGQRDRQIGQRDEENAMTAADKGLEKAGGGGQAAPAQAGGGQQRMGNQPAPGGQGGADPQRMAQMQAEMARGKGQMSQGIEQGTQGRGYVKTAGRQQAEAEEQGVERTKAAASAYAAVTSRRRLGFEMQKAQAQMDVGATKVAKAEVAAAMERAEGPLDDFTSLLDRLEKMGDQPSKLSGGLKANDWTAVAELFGKTPPVGNAADIKASIDNKQTSPRLMAWLSEKQAHMVVQFVAEGTGVLPNSKYIDTLSEGWKVFNEQVQMAKKQFGIDMGGPGGLMTTRTRFRMKRMAQKMAAKAILTGQLMTEGGEPGPQGAQPVEPLQGTRVQGDETAKSGGSEEPDMALARTPEKQAAHEQSQRPQGPNPPGEEGYIHPMSSMGGPGRGSQGPKWSDVR